MQAALESSAAALRGALEVVPREVEELQGAVQQALEARDLTMAHVQVSIRAIVKAGALLRVQRARVEPGQWIAWLEHNLPVARDTEKRFTRETARKWMKLAEFVERCGEEKLENAGSVRQAYVLAELLPEPEASGGGAQGSKGTNYLEQLQRCQRLLPIDSAEALPREDKVVLKERLRPYVDLYERL